jgi:hypothetical protein
LKGFFNEDLMRPFFAESEAFLAMISSDLAIASLKDV